MRIKGSVKIGFYRRPGTLSTQISSQCPHNRHCRCRGIIEDENAVNQHDSVFP